MSSFISAKNLVFNQNCLIITNKESATIFAIPLINVVAYLQKEENYGDVTIEFIMLGGYQIKVHTERNLDKNSWSAISKFLNAWLSKFEPKPETGDLLNINTKEGKILQE